jgi:tRNA-binding protein
MSDTYAAFQTLEIRVGTVLEAHPFPEARVPAIKLHIDFGESGRRWSSAQITERYTPEDLPGRQVLAVTNLPPKRIAGFKSECLTLGFHDHDGAVVLARPDSPVPDGARLL